MCVRNYLSLVLVGAAALGCRPSVTPAPIHPDADRQLSVNAGRRNLRGSGDCIHGCPKADERRNTVATQAIYDKGEQQINELRNAQLDELA